jgi:hypothetical protein
VPVPTAKELKKLAKACREAGIHYFKSADFEFTLTGVPPEKITKNKSVETDVQGDIESDTLTEEELLYWSTQGVFASQDNA